MLCLSIGNYDVSFRSDFGRSYSNGVKGQYWGWFIGYNILLNCHPVEMRFLRDAGPPSLSNQLCHRDVGITQDFGQWLEECRHVVYHDLQIHSLHFG